MRQVLEHMPWKYNTVSETSVMILQHSISFSYFAKNGSY